jgi:hypothetical protein
MEKFGVPVSLSRVNASHDDLFTQQQFATRHAQVALYSRNILIPAKHRCSRHNYCTNPATGKQIQGTDTFPGKPGTYQWKQESSGLAGDEDIPIFHAQTCMKRLTGSRLIVHLPAAIVFPFPGNSDKMPVIFKNKAVFFL